VQTVRLGRRIYHNIRNAMRYIISVHVPTAGMAFLPLLLGEPLLLFPVHVVFLEFVIDPACTLVYEAESTDKGAMRRPPRDPREPLFNLRMLAVSLVLGATMLAAVMAVYGWALRSGYPGGETRAIAFAAMVLSNLALILVTLGKPNAPLWWIACGALVALSVSIYVPAAATIFRFSALTPGQLALAVLAAIAGVAWYQAWKVFDRNQGAAVAAGHS